MSAREAFEKQFKLEGEGCEEVYESMFVAFQAGLEAAAKVCDEKASAGNGLINTKPHGALDCVSAIRKLKE